VADGKVKTTTVPNVRPGEASGSDEARKSPLGGRVFRPRNAASFLLGLAVLYLVYRQFLGLDWDEAWASIRGANAWLFALAFLVFYCSFPVRGLRWKVLLENVGYSRETGQPVPSAVGLTRIMYLAWFANCVTVARLGDAYRAYLLKREAGVSFTVTLGTVLAERLLDLVVLALILSAGVLVVFGSWLPPEVAWALAAGLVLSAVGVVGLLFLRRFGGVLEKVLTKRLRTHYSRLRHGLTGSFRGRLPRLVALSVAGWVLEGAALYATVAAVGTPVPVVGALVVALAASLLSTVPITPAGLGFTEAGMVVLLGWLGLDLSAATAVTLLFRLINYWSIVALGLVLYVYFRNAERSATERKQLRG
jgi:glycosyltransferase 2 family protein